MPPTPRIILASGSVSRHKLMKALNIPFECHAADIYEDMESHADPVKLVEHLATQKAQQIAPKYPHALIIGVDTFILIGKHKIGKAKTNEEAAKILKKMSGNTIEVISGLSVLKTDESGRVTEKHVSHAITKLRLKEFTPQEIEYFSTRDEALKFAGVFGIEGEGGRLVKTIDGDFNNVVGIPIFQLKEVLEKYGIVV